MVKVRTKRNTAEPELKEQGESLLASAANMGKVSLSRTVSRSLL